MRMKEAYDVLADAERRAAYDRSARAAGSAAYAKPEVDNAGWPTPRFWDLTMVLWVVLAGALILASVMLVVELGWLGVTGSRAAVARAFVPGRRRRHAAAKRPCTLAGGDAGAK